MRAAGILLALAMAASPIGAALADEWPGMLEWSQVTALALPVSGVVHLVPGQPGQRVARGDLLLSLEPTLFQAQVMEARAEAERQTEEEAEARRDLERVKELYARTVSSTTELDNARLRQARAQAALTAAQARLERARRLLAESELRAPYDALILERRVNPGQAVAAQCQPPHLFTLARADELVASASLPVPDALALRPGVAVVIQLGENAYPGTLRAIRMQPGEPARLEAVLPFAAGLYPGQPIRIKLWP